MKRFIALCLSIMVIATPTLTVSASPINDVSDKDVIEGAAVQKEVDVTASKDSTFTVSVPIIQPMDTDATKAMIANGGIFSKIGVKGDISSDKYVSVQVSEDLTMVANGTGKDSVIWKSTLQPSLGYDTDFNAANISGDGISRALTIKPNEISAGTWTGSIHVSAELKDYGIMLTAEQFKQYVATQQDVTTITIPKTIQMEDDSYLVRGIGNGALSSYPNLTDVTLETDGTFYFDNAFDGLTSSSSITITGNSNTVVVSDSSKVTTNVKFVNCSLCVNGIPYTESTNTFDMSNVTAITQLEGSYSELILSDDIQYIGSNSFSNAIIDKLVIPNLNYNAIQNGVLNNPKVSEASIAMSSVNNNLFKECTALKKVVFEDGVTSIGSRSFYYDTSLEDVTIPSSVTSIGAEAFEGTPWLEKLKASGEDVIINDIFICEGKKASELEYSEDGKTLIKVPTDYVGTVDIPEGVTSIAAGALEDNSYDGVTTIKIPSTITSIANDAITNLAKNFSTGKIELSSENKSFIVLSKMSTYKVDDTGIGMGPVEGLTLLLPAATSLEESYLERNQTVYKSDSIVALEGGNTAASMSYPVWFDGGAYGLSVSELGTVTPIVCDNHGNVIDIKLYKMERDSYEETWTETSTIESSFMNEYRIEIPSGGAFLMLSMSNATTDRNTLEGLVDVFSVLQYTSDYKTLTYVPSNVSGNIHVKSGVTSIAADCFDMDAYVDDGGYQDVDLFMIPATVTYIDPNTLDDINNIFSETDVMYVEYGNTKYVHFAGTSSNINECIYEAGTLTSDNLMTNVRTYYSLDNTVYYKNPTAGEALASYDPIYLEAGTYTFAAHAADVWSMQLYFVGSNGLSTGNGAQDDPSWCVSGSGTLTYTVPAAGAFVYINWESSEDMSYSRYYKKPLSNAITITKTN